MRAVIVSQRSRVAHACRGVFDACLCGQWAILPSLRDAASTISSSSLPIVSLLIDLDGLSADSIPQIMAMLAKTRQTNTMVPVIYLQGNHALGEALQIVSKIHSQHPFNRLHPSVINTNNPNWPEMLAVASLQ